MLRLTWQNGYESLHTLHRAIGAKYREHYDGNISSITEALSAAINLEKSALESYFNFESDFALDSQRAITDIRCKEVRICPCCVQEQAFIDQRWQLAHNTHCAKHSVSLIDSCPRCGQTLLWSPDLFEGCTNPECDFKWSSFSFLHADRPSYLVAESLLLGHEKREFLQQLYQAFVYTMRPLDCTYDCYKTLPRGVSKLQERFSTAYSLIRNNAFLDEWLNHRRAFFEGSLYSNNNICLNAIQPAISTLNEKEWLPEASHFGCFDALETELGIPYARYQRLKNDGDARFQLKVSDVAHILEVSNTAVIHLAHKAIIQAEKSSKTDATYLFDFRDVMRFIASFAKRALLINRPTSELISLEDIKKKSRYFDIANNQDAGVIFEAIIGSDIQIFALENSRLKLSDLFFNREQILNTLDDMFAQSFQDVYPKTTMRETCGFNEVQYYAFRELFHEKLVLKKNQHKYIAADTLRTFFQENVLLNRWCMLRDLDITEAITKLNKSGISYQYPSLLKAGIFIIPQSKSHLL